MGLGLWTAFGGGCVTDTIPFDRKPIEAPVILSSPTSQLQIGDKFWVDRSRTMSWPMQVLVREKDPTRKLIAHHRMVDPEDENLAKQPPPFEAVPVPLGSGEQPELRTLAFEVRTESLSIDSCRRLELVVSGSFDEDGLANAFFDYIPNDDRQHDLAWAVWWVWEGTPDRNDPAKLVRSCRPEALMPAMTPAVNGDSP